MEILQNKDARKVGVFITTIGLNLFTEATCSGYITEQGCRESWRFHYNYISKPFQGGVFIVIKPLHGG